MVFPSANPWQMPSKARCPLSASFQHPSRNSAIPAAPSIEGDMLVQADLANTLERIAKDGPKDFYRGKTGKLLLKEMKAGKGLIAAWDLKAYRPVKRVPVVGHYRGYEVIGAPPPCLRGHQLFLLGAAFSRWPRLPNWGA
jgi:gamma-glutamyltranspeptidase/glutathione hydrolase